MLTLVVAGAAAALAHPVVDGALVAAVAAVGHVVVHVSAAAAADQELGIGCRRAKQLAVRVSAVGGCGVCRAGCREQ